jgi:nucleotide-binding universal stress UspA family protein
MSYRTILVPMAQRENAQSALEAAFLVARRFAGHVHGLHVLPDLANPATHALVATRMTAEEARAISGDSGLPRSTCCGGRRLS